MTVSLVGAAFADEATPAPTNNLTLDTSISITGLETGDVVDFYQVLKYDQTAAKGWSKTADFNLSDDQVNAILTTGITAALANTIAGMVPETPTAAHYTVTESSGTASQSTPEAGLYVAIITPHNASTLYSPVFVGADYYTQSPDHSTWAMTTAISYSDEARAKKSSVTVEKTATEYTHDNNEIVSFTISTQIPSFPLDYTNPKFIVTDSLSTGLLMVVDESHPFTVTPAGAVFTGTPESGVRSFVLNFNSTYLKGLTVNTPVTITYYARLTNEAPYNVNPEDNTVTVQYSNGPDSENDYGLLKDKTNHYTFSLDADILGQEEYEGSEIVKVGVDKDGNMLTETRTTYHNNTTVSPLQGAHFKLTTDQAGNNVYSNNVFNGADFVSLANGKFTIKGLDAGTYYMTETQAPAGYVKDTTVYKIEIIADEHMSQTTVNETDISTGKSIAVTYNTNVLDSYEVKITPIENGVEGTAVTSTFTMTNTNGTPTKSEPVDRTTAVTNTKGVELPSTGGIGTTLFYVIGIVLVLGAAAVIISRRKAEQE